MCKRPKYFDLVYDDFIARVEWYYIHELLSSTELESIVNSLSIVKSQVECNHISQRQGIMKLTNVFRDYFLI